MVQNKSLSAQEVAQILHVSKSTIYELIRRGEINSYKIGRKVRFTQDDVDAYIARSRHEQSVQPVKRVELQSELLHPRREDKGQLILSGQDVLLDGQLHRMGLDKRMVAGYEREMKSHLTMAAAIAAGEADLAVGTERISRQIEGLGFIPLMQERFDLAVHKEFLETDAGETLLEILRSEAFKKEILPFSGNDYRDLGRIVAEV